MSDLEKTGNKLLASIKKTKSGSDTAAVKTAKKKTTGKPKKSKASVAPKTKKAPKAKKPVAAKKAAPKAAPKPKKVATKKKATTAVVENNTTRIKNAIAVDNNNPYADGSQVWPD